MFKFLGSFGKFREAEVMAPLLADYIPEDINEEEEVPNIYNYQNTPENKSWAGALPLKQGLYDPELEKDACGVGFAA